MKATKENHKFTIGVFYRTQRPIYHKKLYGDYNPVTKRRSRETRLDKIHNILISK